MPESTSFRPLREALRLCLLRSIRPLVHRARVVVLLIGAGTVIAGCDGDPTGGEPPRDVAGTYVLTAIRGEPLPWLYQYHDGYDTRVDMVGGELILRADGTFEQSDTLRYTEGTLGGRVEEGSIYAQGALTGTYEVRGDSIYYEWPDGRAGVVRFPGVVMDGSVTGPTYATYPGTFDQVEQGP
jgi:hypothetical protein